MSNSDQLVLLESPRWESYELLDSGGGQKLERFDPYLFVRPEPQAIWSPALPDSRWREAHAIFRTTGEESGGHWLPQAKLAEKWRMSYSMSALDGSMLPFWAMTTPGRHLGVFPEAAAHWEFAAKCVRSAAQPIRVLNLFGYTGLASLAAAAAGAQVTHVDAKPGAGRPGGKTHSLDRG
jgi:23S rRNA (cytosine1962-C5)-methyltransferase